MTVAVYSLSISARLTLDMHSLNNEGSEGNQLQTRMVDIVAADGRLYNVNAISGDMLKHIQAEHFYRVAQANPDLPLCSACRQFDANRISADTEFQNQIVGKRDSEAIDLMLQRCALDDVEGILLTAGRSTPRKSVVEFGWVVGVPINEEGREQTTTGSYFHVKYASERAQTGSASVKSDAERAANLGQIPFHRPASSGIYAFVNHYEISRIGYNDITHRYAIDDAQRASRHRALLESILYSFLALNGAMRSTQLPHLVAAEGAVTYTTHVVPAPTVSPLHPDYSDEIQRISDALNKMRPGAVTLRRFEKLSELAVILTELMETTVPYSVALD